MIGVFVAEGSAYDTQAIDEHTNNWTGRASRGECAWICADCCCFFEDGMPDACIHGHEKCTEIIQRDKRLAQEGGA